jgi:hypothetical protein
LFICDFPCPVAPVDLTFILEVEIISKAQRKFKSFMIALPFLRRECFGSQAEACRRGFNRLLAQANWGIYTGTIQGIADSGWSSGHSQPGMGHCGRRTGADHRYESPLILPRNMLVCTFRSVGKQVNFVSPNLGQAIGQLGRVFFSTADETIFRDDNGNLDETILFHASVLFLPISDHARIDARSKIE